MIKKIDNYKHIIYECKTDEEVIKSQDIAFKGGWRWRGDLGLGNLGNLSYHGTTLSRMRCIILQKNKKIEKSSDMTPEQILRFYHNDGCLVVKSLLELNILVNGINCNEKRELVYD